MVRVKFGDCIPFPDKQGVWVRLVMGDSPDKEQSIVITQGHVVLFQGEKAIILDKGQETTAEIIMQGDLMCQKDGYTVAYTPINGVAISKRPAKDDKPNGLIVPGGVDAGDPSEGAAPPVNRMTQPPTNPGQGG